MDKDIAGQDLDWRKVYLDTKQTELLAANDLLTDEQRKQQKAKEERQIKHEIEHKKRQIEKDKIRHKLKSKRSTKEGEYMASQKSLNTTINGGGGGGEGGDGVRARFAGMYILVYTCLYVLVCMYCIYMLECMLYIVVCMAFIRSSYAM